MPRGFRMLAIALWNPMRSQKRWRRLTLLLLAAVSAIALTACNPARFTTTENATARLVFGALSDPKTFNPVLNTESPNVFTYTFEGLTDTDGMTGEVVPAQAESWEVSEDGKTVIFTLRPDLRWSDGEPLTAADVVFTYRDVIFNEEIPTSSRDVLRIGPEGLLPTVTQLSDRQVRFDLPEPFAPFLRTASIDILPAHILRDTITERDADGNLRFLSTWTTSTDPSQIVSNGPYRIQQYLPSERIVFEANPNYWREGATGDQPYIPELIWQVVESTDTQLLQFRSGGLDLMSVSPDFFALLKREEERGDFTIYNGGPAPGTNFIGFNLNRASRDGEPLVDPVKSRWFNTVEFRQAVAYAIDRQAMINNIFQGLGSPQTSPISVQSPYYAPPETGIPTYDYDPARSRELLTGAGFQYNAADELLDSEGNRVRFTLITNAGNKIREAIGAQVKRDLSQIGIQVDFQPIAFNTLVNKLTDGLDWEAHILGFTGGVEPNNGANIWLLNGTLHTFNQQAVASQSSLTGWEAADWERRIADLYIEAAQATDEARRKELYQETQRLTQEYLPFIYLVNPLSLGAVRNRVEGIEYSALGGALWNVYELRLTEK